MSRPGGQAMVPWANATPRNGMGSTGIEMPSFDSAKINRYRAREEEKSFVARAGLSQVRIEPGSQQVSEVNIASSTSRSQSMNVYQNGVAFTV